MSEKASGAPLTGTGSHADAPSPKGLGPLGFDPSRDECDFHEYDDDRDEGSEWCDRCQGLGTADCHCGGDQCYCENYGKMQCPQCHGEGFWTPTPAQLAARAETAKWVREMWARHEARDSDRSGEADETGTGSAVGESAGPQDIAQPQSPSPNTPEDA